MSELTAELRQRRDAARLGMAVFLSSESMLFGALIAVFFALRVDSVPAFHEGARHALLWVGTSGTAVLLAASALAAAAGELAGRGRARATAGCLLGAAALGLVFLGLKLYEYHDHVVHGLVPGGRLAAALQSFWTLYWVTTGLHALHVLVGVAVLTSAAAWSVRTEGLGERAHVVENCADYWHLVDAVWLLLWPMFYLMRGGGP
ncbi:MAG: cytochrome c oxidase subunit 3 [Myxococcota bacterium]